MSLVIPPGYASAALVFSGTAGTPAFVMTLGVDLGPAGGLIVNAANRVMASYKTHLMTRTSNSVRLEYVSLAVGSASSGGSVQSDVSPLTGSLAGADAALSMSVIVQKRTGRLGRTGRGRMFALGLLDGGEVSTSGIIPAAAVSAIQTDFNAFLNALDVAPTANEAPVLPVLLHGDGPSTIGLIPDPITALVVQPKVGWIRGRIR